ncbi:NADH dehydrogenase [ubiquinone] 1 beta subcomplex subunit 1 isoform X1 [Lacerta agilis]|uniref:NADH dehydrogenase [ubiquinone] 1 beta subcomplex subunit 1 isoform X1 n=2 Tax=Lacerta agilis TaxID=80427 RepID=UPI00141978E8|nr:NADH dehydrogenase [ubiquinone] 1 beta subcomplex subunit 1 isoform X1 [Lacerta agilis]
MFIRSSKQSLEKSESHSEGIPLRAAEKISPAYPSRLGEWFIPALVIGGSVRGSLSVLGWLRPSVTMVNILHLVRDHWAITLVPIGFVLGCYLDRRNDEKMALFRNKSKLFQRELKPGEEVTWR